MNGVPVLRPSRLRDRWQYDLDTATATGRTHDIDNASQPANNALHHREPQAAAGELRGEERVESPALRLRRHPASSVRDLQPHVVTFWQVLRRLKRVRARPLTETTGSHSNYSIPIADRL